MIWKVYNIQSGKVVAAGFDNEDEASDWLEKKRSGSEDNYAVEEMDHDEEAAWLEAAKDGEDKITEDDEEDRDFERDRYNYSTDDEDTGLSDEDVGLLSEVDEDDEE